MYIYTQYTYTHTYTYTVWLIRRGATINVLMKSILSLSWSLFQQQVCVHFRYKDMYVTIPLISVYITQNISPNKDTKW